MHIFSNVNWTQIPQRKCRVSFVGGTTGYAPVSSSIHKEGISSAKVSRKLRGSQVRLEVHLRATRRQEVWSRRFAWASRKLYIPGKISTPVETCREWRILTEELLDGTLLLVLALHQTIKGWELEKNLSCPSVAKAEKQRKTKNYSMSWGGPVWDSRK